LATGPFDAIVILGGGLRDGGLLPPWSIARFERALERQTGTEAFICLSQATVHRPPPLDGRGFPVTEAAAGARYLIERGIEPERIRLEALSLETIGNAAFTRLLHTDVAGWRRLLVVTSAFHMPRSRAIFEKVFALEPSDYELEFAAAENRGLTPEAVAARLARELKSLGSWQRNAKQWKTISDFSLWLWTQHDAYSGRGLLKPRPALDPATIESY